MRGPFRMWAKRVMARATGKVYLRVAIAYDAEARVWFVHESDVPGLHLEGETAGELIDKLEAAAPEMIDLNMAWIKDNWGFNGRTSKPTNVRTEFIAPLPAAC